MDRYKFRGKRVDNGEWVYGYLTVAFTASTGYSEKGPSIQGYASDDMPYHEEVHPDTVGQWTGESKWDEGKRVLDYYEGDIVECTLLNVNTGSDVVIGTGVITYSCAGFDVVMDDGTLGKRGRCNLQNIREVGTIHDKE